MAHTGRSQAGLRLETLETRLQEILQAREAAEQAFYSLRAEAEQDSQAFCERHERELENALAAQESYAASQRKRTDEVCERRIARADASHGRLRDRIQAAVERAGEQRENRLLAAREEASRAYEQRFGADGQTPLSETIQALLKETEGLQDAIERFAPFVNLPRADPEAAAEPSCPLADLKLAVDGIAGDLQQVGARLESLRHALRFRATRRLPAPIGYALIGLGHAAILLAGYLLGLGFMGLGVLGLALAVSLLLVLRAYRATVRDLADTTIGLRADVTTARAGLQHLYKRYLSDKASWMTSVGKDTEKRAGGASPAAALADLQARHKKLIDKIQRAQERNRAFIEANLAEMRKRLEDRAETALQEYKTAQAETLAKAEKERRQTVEDLAEQWGQALEGFRSFARELTERSRAKHPPWSDAAWQAWTLPAAFSEDVPVGSLQFDLETLKIEPDAEGVFALGSERALALPVALSYPLSGSMLIRASGAKRHQALGLLFSTILRILASFPPGKAKFTILDPVGLGESFSALMHLTDYDESLVAGRIWTETVHMENRLAELTEHIEKVIQKYLRNRYATIAEYNQEAGEMAEAYQFLVVADFPTGFSELALERLASIISSGARCGVYTLILYDQRQKLPAGIDLGEIRRNGLMLAQESDGFAVDDPLLKRGTFIYEERPDDPLVDRILQAVGTQHQAAKEVQVPFSAVAPPSEDVFSSSAQDDIRVPIGRAGADRLQYLSLGRGTAQHALISGRTGSGKSNLFHVIITNIALWFSPEEIELHLVDFKKGVEFKTYAINQLPHARVIAIESDREFGLSVLRRLDEEMTRRGELFRQLGVQNIASARRDGLAMPRTLLVIDEFQELFTEDDAIAQGAALLLDRFVRQGRAFGMHVLLGSQTLSGVYSLAKSTMGQMGVRIALQCNEADSYLILSDDNAAARLLSRPGEAIYNDMLGLVEGNNPFQVVWMPEEVQEERLREIAQRASEAGIAGTEAVVFEGNMPAQIERNPLLSGLLGRAFKTEDVSDRVWLGEPNAIKGPTEVCFPQGSGGNLLILGQRRDGALGMVASVVVSLAAQHLPNDLRVVAFDGTGSGSESQKTMAGLAEAIPHPVELVPGGEIPECIAALAETLKARQEGDEPSEQRILLVVFGLQRLRQLRQEDEYAFAASSDEQQSAGESFAEILREGPAQGIHTMVWCDALSSLNRALSRRTLREFDMRVLFQMSASDSSELIDSPQANRLAFATALLSVESDGTLESFRPYAVPGTEYMNSLHECCCKRFAAAVGAGEPASKRKTAGGKKPNVKRS